MSSELVSNVVTEEIEEFSRTGRTGRRNAVSHLPTDPNITLSTVEITDLMCKIECKDTKKLSKNESSSSDNKRN